MKKKLAKITSAKLEIQGRGILNFWITVDYEDGLSQNIGGITLDTYDKSKEKRVGTAYGCEMIRRILLELQVDDFSEMKGKIIWVIGEGEDFNFKVAGIRSLKVNNDKSKKLIFDDVLKEFEKE